MKTKILPFASLLLCVFALSLPCSVALSGCSSTAQLRTYQTVSTTVITADAAMTGWGNYVAQFHPPVADEQKVKAAYDKYRAASILVADAGKALAEGTGSQASLDAAISTAAASLSDLVTLIQQFGVKLATK